MVGVGDYPIIEIEMLVSEGMGDSGLSRFKALCDTGSSGGIALTTDQVTKLGITLGKSINVAPIPNTLADNSIVYSNEYRVTVSFHGEKLASRLSVLDPKSRREPAVKELGESEVDDIAIVGRRIMDRYAITYDGTMSPKRLSFSQ